MRWCRILLSSIVLGQVLVATALGQERAEALDMALVGYHDLQGRSAYQPLVHAQGGRWIAYIGLHGDRLPNELTGAVEDSGTAILDVTDPRQPKLLAHIPGEPGRAEAGGAPTSARCTCCALSAIARRSCGMSPTRPSRHW